MKNKLKKLIITVSLIFLILSSAYVNHSTTALSAEKIYYARITTANVYLYRTASISTDYSNLFFLLPQSYFVKLTGENNNFFSVEYLDIVGFVLKSQVQCVNETPQRPYLSDITFSIAGNSNCRIRYEPSTRLNSNSQIGLIPLNDNTPIYYGSIEGDEVITSRGTLWYYAKYTSSQNAIHGYVYAALTGNLTTIIQNTESVTYLDNVSLADDNTQGLQINLAQILSSTEQIIIIALMGIPAIILLYLLFKPSKSFNNCESLKNDKPKNSTLIMPHKKTFGDIDKSLDFDDDL